MRNLYMFEDFRAEKFFEDKDLLCVECGELLDHNDNSRVLGTVVYAVIVNDRTDYNGKPSNRFEKLKIKVFDKNLKIPKDCYIKLFNPSCKIFGDYRNQLSTTAEDIIVLDGKIDEDI